MALLLTVTKFLLYFAPNMFDIYFVKKFVAFDSWSSLNLEHSAFLSFVSGLLG